MQGAGQCSAGYKNEKLHLNIKLCSLKKNVIIADFKNWAVFEGDKVHLVLSLIKHRQLNNMV